VPALFVIYYRWFRRTSWFENLIFGCVMGGALGNGYDRVAAMLGWSTVSGVRDFITVDLGVWPANPWPTFNVADIGISIGFIGLLLVSFKPKRHLEGDTGDSESPDNCALQRGRQ
jgi:signal peptidase II